MSSSLTFFLDHFIINQLYNSNLGNRCIELESFYLYQLAYLRDVIEYGECEAGENEPEKEKEPNDGLVHVAVLHVAQGVPRDVVAQPDGCN